MTALALTVPARGSGHRAALSASFTVRSGETVALIGGRGTGKSALISVVAGLLTPATGVVSICGAHPAPAPDGPDCGFPVRLLSTWDLLLASRHGAPIGRHGENCCCRSVLVADEPSSGLPRAHRARVWRALSAARAAGQAVLVALRAEDAFDAHYDRAYLLEDGVSRPSDPAPPATPQLVTV